VLEVCTIVHRKIFPNIFLIIFFLFSEEIRQLSSRNPQSDVWSLGCVLYAMLSGTLPFNDDFLPRLQATIINSRYNKERLKEARCSDEVIALIEGMLKVKLADRFCMDDIIRHPWFSL
jgi:serine/threonine protein kinase